MHDVYSNAAITVAADAAWDSSVGLFPERKARVQHTVEIPITWKCAGVPETVVIEGPSNAFDFEMAKNGGFGEQYGQPLTSRAWAMQERLLSPRILHFVKGPRGV